MKKLTVRIPAELREALHLASLAAGGYGHQTRLLTEALQAHPEIKAQLERIREGGQAQ